MSGEDRTNVETSAEGTDAVFREGEDAVCDGLDEEDDVVGDEKLPAAALELAEHNALAQVFDDVRRQSAASCLVQPTRWESVGLVPEHLDPEEFEMLVYEYLEEARAEAAAAIETPSYRTATRAVGVPLFGKKEVIEAANLTHGEALTVCGDENASEASQGTDNASVAFADSDSTSREFLAEEASEVEVAQEDECGNKSESHAAFDSDDPFANLNIPEGFRLVELEGEYVLVPDDDAAPVERTIECSNVAVLVGAHSYYLYDCSVMTDTYAHWAFLAAEDDKVVTFVDFVREDSRVYPRPLAASSLTNEPFNMNSDDVTRTWDIVRESGEYPDIHQTIASNGDVYYFSTDYLSEVYAASLAEWDAVERKMNM
ncbi:MAG: hypothetical protein VB027_04965 [Gordonibacter sp.]|nr:hypothetical protein [Gordonibacter sp.]